MKISFLDKMRGHKIIAYLGLTGAGKTLSAVENHVLPALVLKRKVYSNTWLNWKGDNLHYFTSWEELHDVRNAIIFIDEVGDLLDPNKFKDYSDADKNVIRYHRKRRNTIIVTGQDISDLAKQIRTKIHFFILCESILDNALVVWFFKFFYGYERVSFKVLQLTFKDLKKLSLGIGSPAIIDESDEESEGSFSDDISDITESLKSQKDVPVSERLNFTVKTLNHIELDEFKLFKHGAFCPECSAFVSKFDEIPVELPICDAHKEIALEVKAHGMYDTNYELIPRTQDWVLKKYRYIMRKTLVSAD